MEGIQFAHSKNIQHRDISPNNVLIFINGNQGTVKLADFGLGKIWSDDSGHTHFSENTLGQLSYSPPEQFDSLHTVTHLGDIYSLGKLLDYILTGKNPKDLHSTGVFGTLIKKATQREPADRHRNIKDFARAFTNAKSVQLATNDPYVEINALLAFRDSNGTVGWSKFHDFAVFGRKSADVYSDYIDPVLSALEEFESVKAYVNTLGDAAIDFLVQFDMKLSELPNVGWPFEILNDVCKMYNRIHFASNNQEVKDKCIIELWDYAYCNDRFTAQKIMKTLFEKEKLSVETVKALAMHIRESNRTYDLKYFSDIKMPNSIATAVTANGGLTKDNDK